jgi:hypothetical protein
MKLLRRRRAETEPAAGEDRSEEETVREVGEPDPARVTVGKDPVTGKWTSLKGM